MCPDCEIRDALQCQCDCVISQLVSSVRCFIGRRKIVVFRYRLDAVVDHVIFSSVGRRFQTRGAATENALSPIFCFAHLSIRSLLLDDCNDNRSGSLAFTGLWRTRDSAKFCFHGLNPCMHVIFMMALLMLSQTFFSMRRAICLELTSSVCHRNRLTVCIQI